MQAVRDAFTLLLVILAIATIRVSPVPEIELPTAQASPARSASAVHAEADMAPSEDPAVVEPAGHEVDAPCPGTLAVRLTPETDGQPRTPCDV